MVTKELRTERRHSTTNAAPPRKPAPETLAEPELLANLGFKIRGFGPLPEGFDPLTATDEQLTTHRLPRRPDARTERELRALWERMLSRTKVWIAPEFEYMERRTHARRGGDVVDNATNPQWSGAVVSSAEAASPYTFVAGQWTVPSPNTTVNGSYSASEWVGIDGWGGSVDVLQAGTETAVTKSLIFELKQVYTWWEWYPANEVKISNLPVSPGDVMYCLISADSTTHATVTFTNASRYLGTRFEITPPAATALVGNSAEWIVERPNVNNIPAPLTDYGVCYFDECIAGGSGQADNLSSATLLTMTGTGGATLSEPVRENDHVLKVNWLKSS